MKRPAIFSWYYNEGLHELAEIWKNYIFFAARYFSTLELLRTLFSPWHRDVEIRNWRGFNPKRFLENLFFNLISRLLGAVVRLAVIFFGLVALLFVLGLGLLTVILWVGAPVLFLVFCFGALVGKVALLPLIAGTIFYALGIWFLYRQDTQPSLLQLQFENFPQNPIFERVCARLGFSTKRFPKEILENEQAMDDFLKAHNLTRSDYLSLLKIEFESAEKKAQQKKFWRWENLKLIAPLGNQWKYAYTVHLDRFAQDLSRGDYSEYSRAELLGRNDEFEILQMILQRPDQNCALIVGGSGIGKKTLLHSLARKIRNGQADAELKDTRILLLDLGQAISETLNKGEDVEQFLRVLFYEASYAGNVILVLEHLENFLGKEGNLYHPDISSVLAEFLSVPTFQVIATSTPNEYHKLIEKHDQIAKYFEVIEMREPSEEDTLRILHSQLEKYERSRVLFTYKALKSIVTDSAKFNWEFPLPERAIDLMMDVLMFWEKKSDEQFVTEKTLADYLSLKTGSPHGEIEGQERKKLLNLEESLHQLVIGQEEAVKQVAEALRRARSGIGDSKKPVGSFLFLGPTGVGKTETAKALAQTYFGDEKHMIRLDMSEFQTPNSIDRLLGSSQLNQPGRLVTQIKDNPYSLLLLDEIEKAYPEILDIFLQILDEGFVTDAFGEKINFRNTIIIATSNAGAMLIKKMVAEKNQPEDIKQAVIDYTVEKGIFRVEFLNRFEGVIFFRPLNAEELKSVVRLQLQKFANRLSKEKNIEIQYEDSVVEKIIEKGYNPVFGARSLNRYIGDAVENFVAKKIISGEAVNGEKITIEL